MLFRVASSKQTMKAGMCWMEYAVVRCHSTLAVPSSVSTEALELAKPFEAIPGPKGYPFLGTLPTYLPIIGKYPISKWHESQRDKFKTYGKIVREKLFPGINDFVHLFNASDMEAVYRQEGKQPTRMFFLGMKDIREKEPDVYKTIGLAPSNGEQWYEVRSRTQQVMMRPQVMKMYLPQINAIADDFILRLKSIRTPEKQAPDLMNELFKWALESVAYVMLQKRMNCFQDSVTTTESQNLITLVNEFFKCTGKVELGLPLWKLSPVLSPSYQKMKRIHNYLFNIAMDNVKMTLEKIQQRGADDDSDMPLLEMMLQRCSPEVASIMAVDAIIAGIDTTSLSTAYVMRSLAGNPAAQARLQEEVDKNLPYYAPVTREALEKMPYLKACIKESMRLYPTVQGTSRTLDHDIVLSGYRVPAETIITLNYNVTSLQNEYFPDADQYKPERWLKGPSSSAATGSFAFLPFGFGPRMCIGRRIADLEMLTLISKLMQHFWIENDQDDIDISFQLVLMITSPLLYKFNDR